MIGVGVARFNLTEVGRCADFGGTGNTSARHRATASVPSDEISASIAWARARPLAAPVVDGDEVSKIIRINKSIAVHVGLKRASEVVCHVVREIIRIDNTVAVVVGRAAEAPAIVFAELGPVRGIDITVAIRVGT